MLNCIVICKDFPMSTRVYDACFVGCGAAAAIHLLAHKEYFREKRVLILEGASSFSRDKTFCSFSKHRIDLVETKTWSRFEAGQRNRIKRFETRIPYHCLDAKKLFDDLELFIAQSPSIEVKFGTRVSRVEQRGGHFVLDGSIEAIHVFDSRPLELKKPFLVQHFLGVELEFEALSPIQDPIIMDIDCSFSQGLKFFYVIPKTPHRLLVELTYFSETPLALEEYRAELEGFLRSRKWPDSRQVGEEYGEIPLVRIVPPCHLPKHYHPLGIRAGHLRASTGYSIWRSYRQSMRGGPLAEHHQSTKWRVIGWMDTVFLSVLYRKPERSSEIFSSFFRRLSGDDIASFMSEEPSWLSLIRVIWAMPKLPFLRALFDESRDFHSHQWRGMS